MSAHSSHHAESVELHQGTMQRYLLCTSHSEPRTPTDKMAPSRTTGKHKPPPPAHAAVDDCEDSEDYPAPQSDSSESTSRSVISAVPYTDPDQAEMPPQTPGGSSRSETMALLSAFQAEFEKWTVKIETSLHKDLHALKQQVSATETAVSALTDTQHDHVALITVLETASRDHLHRKRQHPLRIEDSENRNCKNNVRLRGILEDLTGT